MCTIAAAAVQQTPAAPALAHLHGNDTGSAAAPNNLNIDAAVADAAAVQQAHLSDNDTDTALPNNVNIDTAAAAAVAAAAAAQQADLSDSNADAALPNNVNIDTAAAAASAQADISSSDTEQVVMNSVNIDRSALAAAADTAAAAATATTAAAETEAASFAAVANDTASSSTDRAVVDSHSSGIAASSSELLWDAMRAMHEHESLPLDVACVSKAAVALITSGRPIKVNIRAGMSAATMQSLLAGSNIKHVHIDGHNVGADVIAAIAAELPAYDPYPFTRRVVTTLWPQSFQACTIENFEQWDYTTVLTLMETLPDSVTTLTVAAQRPQDTVDYSMMQCPPGVQTLTARNLLWSVNLNAVLTSSVSQLAAVHFEGLVNCSSYLPRCVKVLDLSKYTRLPQHAQLFLPEGVIALPQRLEVLDTGYRFNRAVDALPSTLKELYIRRRANSTQQYEHELGELPYGLKVLHVANMTHSLGALPNTLEVLHCTNHSHSLGILPDLLQVLKIEGSNFNHPLGLLPDGVLELDLSAAVDFQQPLGILPASLQIVKLLSNYKYLDDVPQHILVVVAAVAVAAEPQHAAAAAAAVAAPVVAAAVPVLPALAAEPPLLVHTAASLLWWAARRGVPQVAVSAALLQAAPGGCMPRVEEHSHPGGKPPLGINRWSITVGISVVALPGKANQQQRTRALQRQLSCSNTFDSCAQVRSVELQACA
eukprot:4394-Heterococcus_DN1.PRE.2